MRFVRFFHDGGVRHGLVEGQDILDLTGVYPVAADAIAAMHKGLTPPRDAPRIALVEVAFLPPTPDGRYFCIGYNYGDHRAEMRSSAVAPPTLFVRNPASMTGHGQPLIHGRATQCYDYEGELAVVIGEPCQSVAEARALDVVAGYCCFMDGSARDLQRDSVGAGKNFDQSGAVGPWVQLARDISDPQDLTIQTRVNGVVVQNASTSDMIVSVAQIIAYISAFVALRPGDVIATGTPSGVGMSHDPPRWLKIGDHVEVLIDGVGRLSNRVVAPTDR